MSPPTISAHVVSLLVFTRLCAYLVGVHVFKVLLIPPISWSEILLYCVVMAGPQVTSSYQ